MPLRAARPKRRIDQHNSWNRAEYSGYKVVFVPFRQERPAGPVEDFLTSFLADAKTGKKPTAAP
jgi:glucose/arabinose dehydrogenase